MIPLTISSFFELSHNWRQLKKPHILWWTQYKIQNVMSCDGPNEVWKSGSIKRHEFFVHSCLPVDPKTSCLLMDPENHQGSIKRHRFWVHQKTWGFGRDVGPSKDMRFYKGKLWNHMYQLGPSKDMRFWKGKILIWVHQKTWGFLVHQKTWGREKRAKFGRVHQKTWVPVFWLMYV